MSFLINSQSLLSIDVGRGSSLSVGGGTGTITNNGTLRVLAGASVAAGNVSAPVAAVAWGGSGTLQAVGGTWNAGSQQFTASPVQSGTSGTPVAIDLASTQRWLISDSATGGPWASFLATTTSTPLDFTATTISGSAADFAG